MLINFIQTLGDKTINLLLSLYKVFRFTFICIFYILQPLSYNADIKKTLVKQIYFTAVTIFPIFIIMAFLFGSMIIGFIIIQAVKYNIQDQLGDIMISFVIEFSPFFTALLISLRSGTTINTKIAVMIVNKTIDKFKKEKRSIIEYFVLPRIISGIISVTSLSIIFVFITLSSSYIFTIFYIDMDIYTYKSLLITTIEVKDIFILLLKGIIFGFISMIIPIYSGLQTGNNYCDIHISVSRGMIHLFIALFFIEGLSLLSQSL
jgi:phospholipid/cholesterol/gamma-HCH transport system permease protein